MQQPTSAAAADLTNGLEVYLVGGAVRDTLLGLPVADRDWVVVGSSAAEMLRRGFQPVGRDFPVFLHPHSGEEYALARRERKTAPGYRGFETESAPHITLEQDLRRRDLTINAMAQDRHGHLIDPYHGQQDLNQGCLRHVSPAFAEDPLRVLRVARFYARLHPRGFRVHSATRELMQQIVARGELASLAAERIWQELLTAMRNKNLRHFIEMLRACGALRQLLPEVDALFGVPQAAKYHPEIDTGVHLLLALDAIEQLSDDPRVVFAVLTHDLGKGITPRADLPSHRGHEHTGLALVRALCTRLRVPQKYRRLALLVCELHLLHHQFATLRPTTMLRLLEKLDALRQPQNVVEFCLACAADLRGRLGRENLVVEQTELIQRAHQAITRVDTAHIAQQVTAEAATPPGEKIASEIRRARCKALEDEKERWSSGQ